MTIPSLFVHFIQFFFSSFPFHKMFEALSSSSWSLHPHPFPLFCPLCYPFVSRLSSPLPLIHIGNLFLPHLHLLSKRDLHMAGWRWGTWQANKVHTSACKLKSNSSSWSPHFCPDCSNTWVFCESAWDNNHLCSRICDCPDVYVQHAQNFVVVCGYFYPLCGIKLK